ncbi:peptidase [Nitrospira sp. KM1]|uniref:PepSY-associated TM helix domain-containing protein n=1 Tax=Nitrospira sp. KM1 TaxID=1936990 RepID=UPI0013A7A3DD|nr:PepSY-associated TM helix domain-containing protein [Nitrospira sp. KM1]BCA56542.1 peptidase [Nitrospira sp. KM1]
MLTVSALKRWYFIHKWTSLICTVFLLLLCLTGLPIVFRDELSVWSGEAVEPPEHVTASVPMSLDTMLADARARRPGEQVNVLSLDDEQPAWFVSMGASPATPRGTALFMYDSRTGEFLHDRPLEDGIINFILKLHVEMLAGLPGTLFLGLMGIVFLLSVVSGIVVYGPFMRKLPFGAIRRDGSSRLTWLDLHNLLGIVTVSWVMVVGATGVINALEVPLLSYWQRTELRDMVLSWKNKPASGVTKPVDDIVATAQSAAPDMIVRFVAFPGSRFSTPHHFMVFMRGQTPLTARLLTPLLIDAETARVSDARSLPWYLTMLRVSQPLHFGDYGGLPLKIVWAVLDLITILVLFSGLFLWWKKRQSADDLALAEAFRQLSLQER